jgi:hypothetical protein
MMLTRSNASTRQTSSHNLKPENFPFRSFQLVEFVPFLLFYSTFKTFKFENDNQRLQSGEILHRYPMDTLWILYENCIEIRMKKPKRICIYPKDIQRITGRSERYGRNILNEIRNKLNKLPHQFVTIEEFANYSGLEINAIIPFIED